MSGAPYRVEPAKSGRSKCSASKEDIEKGELRFGTLVDLGSNSSYKWRKLECITAAQVGNVEAKVGGVKDIDGFSDLTPAEQAKVVKAFKAVAPKAKAKAKGKANAKAVAADDEPPAKKAKTGTGAAAAQRVTTPVPTLTAAVVKAAHKLIDLAKEGAWDKIYSALDKRRELVNVRPDVREYSVLHQAAWHGSKEAVDKLIDVYGADPSQCTKTGMSLLDLAKEQGHAALAQSVAARLKTAGSAPAAAAAAAGTASGLVVANAAAAGASTAASSSSTAPAVAVDKDVSMTTVIAKGGIPVDKYFPDASKYHVYQKDGTIWDCMLNQTNVNDNNNKFYVIQILEKDCGNSYCVWNRWGRVGVKGQESRFDCADPEMAKGQFRGKFQDKTKNSWEGRQSFKAVPGKYTYIEMNYDVDGASDGAQAAPDANVPESQLSQGVQRLVKLICDTAMMQQQMMEIGYDAKKMPLGKISKNMIKEGFEALQVISKELDKAKPDQSAIREASSRFYTVIPHDFGFQHMSAFIITTPKMLSDKLKMVESLADIEVAHRLIEGAKTNVDRNPMDLQYENLKCELTPMKPGSEDWNLLETYIQNTHAATHKQYKLKLKSAFGVEKEGEAERFKPFAKDKNRQLLWHGSRLTNWCGILSQGLRIAPPEAPVSGYMFGKGVYFADMVSKSANYCSTSPSNNTGLMLLAEVALGDMNELLKADFNASQLPKGKLSTKGCGRTAPAPDGSVEWGDGVVVPCGQPKDLSSTLVGSSLLYNEFIVYDISQIRTRFLLEIEFQYGKT